LLISDKYFDSSSSIALSEKENGFPLATWARKEAGAILTFAGKLR
jgi:hypothetical protein